MTTKKSFMFYHNWDEQIDLMTEAELRNFIKNLIRYDKGEDVILNTKEEKLCWLGIVSGLEINKQKWITKSENGKLGGAPVGNKNAIKEKQPLDEKSSSDVSDQEKNNLKQPKTTETSVNSKQLIENSKLETENRKEETEKREQETGPSTGPDVLKEIKPVGIFSVDPEFEHIPSKNFQVDFYNLPAEIKRIVLSEYMKIPEENRPTLELFYNKWEHQLISSSEN
jgi:hypothetical protein